jgi:arylsulfatase A-like enzyme
VSDQVWAFWDFLPTAAELAGVAPPQGIDGISMVNALLGKKQRDHEFLYWEFHERGFAQAVRIRNWKGVRLRGRMELFDLSRDLSEKNDLAAQNPQIVAKIAHIMETARTDSKEFPVAEKAS